MSGKVEEREGDEAVEVVRPGTITGLLHLIAQTPTASLGDRWDQWLRPGAVVGRFQLVRELGRGGFGVVYEARDRELGRTVAFKAVRAGERAALREERLVREAEAAARLSHPNIVTLHDVGRTEHGPYLVLELLKGQTLADRLEQGPLPFREALRIGVDVAKALAHAHAEGVVHRDLKPANVFLCDDGQVKLLDFGLAHALGRRRVDGGTPAYMAPEQWKGAPEDERTDVFALGVLLFRMVSGELPFPEDDDGRAASSSRAAPRLEVPECPALGSLVARTLAKDPVERPRDGGAVLAALSAYQRELDRTPSSPSSPAPRARRGPPANLVVVAAVGVALLLLVALGALLVMRAGGGPASGGAVTVAVADFANQTGEPELDGLSGMLITSLEQSHRLSVLTRARMLDLLRQLGKANVTTVDEALGRELALSAGVRALVVASIRRFDDLYAIELKALDPGKSEYLFTLQEQGRGKASVPAMIDRLSERTRERLRETPAEVQASSARIADLTTSSLEAYQHYFRGEQHKEAIRYEPAIESYRKAIAIDPGFALAHYRIAYLGKFTGLDEADRRASIDAALRHSARVPEKERLLIQAWKAVMDGRKDEAHALYEQVVKAHPDDKEALFMAGDQYLHEDQWETALPYFERAVALDPTFEPALMHLTDCFAALGRSKDLLEASLRWTERAPSAAAFRALSMAYLAEERPEDAIEAARRAVGIDGSGYSRAYLADALLMAERYGEVEELLRPYAAPTASRMDRLLSVHGLVAALAYQGKRAEALRVADTYPEEAEGKQGIRAALKLDVLVGDGPTPEVLREAHAAAAQGAEGKAARSLAVLLAWLGDLEAAAGHEATLAPALRPHYEAAVSWRRGDREAAVKRLRELAKGSDPEGRAPALALLARIASEAKDDETVIWAAESLATAASGPWRSWGYPQSLYLAAQAHERRGERAKAREKLDHVLGMWNGADRDLPMLADVRAARARLGR